LGHVHLDLGDLGAAELCYRMALELREVLAPGSLEVAGTTTTWATSPPAK
jgi:catechol-2,3-dioxygenase